MKKFFVVVLLAFGVALTAALWESAFTRQSPQQRLEAFEKQLHREERRVDMMLERLKPGQEPHRKLWDHKKIILVGFRDNQLVYWSDERIGTPVLQQYLYGGSDFLRINNAYYDVRKKRVGDTDYFALIFMKDDYPITNRYVKNRVNTALGVNLENADKIIIYDSFEEDGETVCNRDGRPLFQVAADVEYEDRLPNFFIIFLYVIAIYLIFYAYQIALKQASSLRRQSSWMLLFVLFLVILRGVMIHYQVPYSLYNMAIFKTGVARWKLYQPVGDLFLTIFFLLHFFYITIRNLRINYQEERLVRYRHLTLLCMVFTIFLYMNFIHYSINSLIDNTQISLNVARIVNIDFSSVLAFVTTIMGIMGLLVVIHGSVRIASNLFSFKELIIGMALIWGIAAGACAVFNLPLAPWECTFAFFLCLVVMINIYIAKGDAQKSIYVVSIIMVSLYITFLSKTREAQRELEVRSYYATEISQEKDTIFEHKLVELNRKMLESEYLTLLVRQKETDKLLPFLLDTLTDLTGFYYDARVYLYSPGQEQREQSDSVGTGTAEMQSLIDSLGIPVKNTFFYNIDEFDGYITYIGRFEYDLPEGKSELFLRFDSRQEPERGGYRKILSMQPFDADAIVYPYSYAKYKDGKLLSAYGSFDYYRNLNQFSKRYEHVVTIMKDGYSHMLIPKEGSGLFVISLGRSYFAPYDLNVLYAILVCLILSSYSFFFQFDRQLWNMKGYTLRKRIKNNVIGLIAAMLLVMTVMSVVAVSAGFERRQSHEVVRLSKYILNELEQYDCIDAAECPEIRQVLADIAGIVQTDMNIYTYSGELVATSMPMIFNKGFDGTLLNPVAMQYIVQDNATSFVQEEKIGELKYIATYVPLELKSGKQYVLSIPYFSKSDELNRDILLLVVISINVAMLVIALAFVLSGVVAERVTQPLQMVNEKLRLMRVGGKNEKIIYGEYDEVGELVKEYNNMVDMLDESVKKLSKAEREGAWQEMARQIAHEIKNPLTPMKLNIQFLQRTLKSDDIEEIRKRFDDISTVLIEQINHMASIATVFSDFAKVSVANNEWINLSEVVESCARLFENNVDRMNLMIMPNIFVFGDKDQVNRVLVNLLKNAEQSIPEERIGEISVTLKEEGDKVVLSVRDNGNGIPEEIRDRIAEPNFTTKSGGMGLGLAMSYRIIETMGGKVYFESVEHEGTVFYVTLKNNIPL